MPIVVKRFFVASLVYLILGLLAQAAAVLDVWWGFNPLAYTAVAATEQLLLLGWLTQLGLALIYDRWLLPAAGFSPRPALVVLVLFNVGLLLVLAGQPGLAMFGRPWLGAAAAAGSLLQLAAGLLLLWQVRRLFQKAV